MSIIKQYHKDTGITYVYESESYWDKEKKQPRSRRKLIGKLDPQTGEVIPTGKKNRSQQKNRDAQPEDAIQDTARLRQDLLRFEKETGALKEHIRELEAENKALRDVLETIHGLVKQIGYPIRRGQNGRDTDALPGGA